METRAQSRCSSSPARTATPRDSRSSSRLREVSRAPPTSGSCSWATDRGNAVSPSWSAECPEKRAEAVVRIADDPALARAMGRRGRALVEREYSWEHITDRWLHELGAA